MTNNKKDIKALVDKLLLQAEAIPGWIGAASKLYRDSWNYSSFY